MRVCMCVRTYVRAYVYNMYTCVCMYVRMGHVFGTSYVIDYLQRFRASNSYRERFPTRIPAIDTNGPREFTRLRVIYNVYTMNLELKFIH